MPAYMIGAAMAVRGYTYQAEPLLAQAIEPLGRYGEPVEWLRAVGFYGHALMAKGQYQQGRAQLERAHTRALELNNPELVVMSYVVRCSFFRTCGDWPEAIACADSTQALAEQLGNPTYVAVACSFRAWAQSYLGQTKEAAENRAQALAVESAMGRPVMLSSWFAAGDCEIGLSAGRYADTIECALALLPRLRAEGEFLAEMVTERALAVARAVIAPAGSDAPLSECLRALTDRGNLVEAARTHVWWGRLGGLRGDLALARHHFGLAGTKFLAAGCLYAHAEAQRLLSSVSPGA
jgi:tetratricopeptide (TPR) repeat protein